VKKLYVGNLSWGTTEDQLKDMFAGQGSVEDVKIITDRETGKSRGFGFVTMASDDEAAKAITEFHGKEVGGRALMVNEAREREGGAGGGRSGGGGGYQGGYSQGGGNRNNGGSRGGRDRNYN